MFDTPQERAGIERGVNLFLAAAGVEGMAQVAIVVAGQAPWWTLIALPLFAGCAAFVQRLREARGDASRAASGEVQASDVAPLPPGPRERAAMSVDDPRARG